MKFLLILLAAAVGAASAVQSVSNGILSGRIGLGLTVLINAAVVLVGAVVFWWVTPVGPLDHEAPRPWYLFLGGIYGLTIIAGAAYGFPRLGAGPTTAIMVAVMLIVAMAFDHLGLPFQKLPITPMRLLGCGLLLIGAVMVLWPKLVERAPAN